MNRFVPTSDGGCEADGRARRLASASGSMRTDHAGIADVIEGLARLMVQALAASDAEPLRLDFLDCIARRADPVELLAAYRGGSSEANLRTIRGPHRRILASGHC